MQHTTMLRAHRAAHGRPCHRQSVGPRCIRPFQPSRFPPTAEDPCSLAAQQTRICCSASSTDQQQQSAPSRQGRMTYRPASYEEMVTDAVKSVLTAIGDGVSRMEVEFPPIPVKIEAYKGASDVYIDANVQLALSAAKQLAAAGRKVHVVLPDLAEYARSYKMFGSTLELSPGVSMGHLREAKAGGDLVSGFQALFSGGAPDPRPAAAAADVYLATNLTCIDLPGLEEYSKEVVGEGKVLVAWNLELDSLRGDLGLLGYPPKDLHHRFLSRMRPVFYVRPRDYSKAVAVAPFIVNYSGLMFREYPGPWQVMLKQDSGEYACIAEDLVRYNLGEVKEELLAAMGLNTEEEGSAMQFLRRGYKTSTWFEDDTELEQSKEWRL